MTNFGTLEDFKKYRKFDVEKYKNISNKILQSERADLLDMSPDFYYRTQVSRPVRSMGRVVSKRRCGNLTDVTQADEDTNSILTDKVNRTIQGNVAMQL